MSKHNRRDVLKAGLGAALALPAAAALSAAPAAAGGLAAHDLRCEHRTDPLGIDTAQPRLRGC